MSDSRDDATSSAVLVTLRRDENFLVGPGDKIDITISGEPNAVSEFLVRKFGQEAHDKLSHRHTFITNSRVIAAEESERENVVTPDSNENP